VAGSCLLLCSSRLLPIPRRRAHAARWLPACVRASERVVFVLPPSRSSFS
jgi:hypothetical protein